MIKALCDQRGTGLTGTDDVLPEARGELLKELRTRGLDNSNMLPEHNVTAEINGSEPDKIRQRPQCSACEQFIIWRHADAQRGCRYGEGGHRLRQSRPDDLCRGASLQHFAETELIQGKWLELDAIIYLHIG